MLRIKEEARFLDKTAEDFEAMYLHDTSERMPYGEYKDKYSLWCVASDYDKETKTIFVHKNEAMEYANDKKNYTSLVFRGASPLTIALKGPYKKGEDARIWPNSRKA